MNKTIKVKNYKEVLKGHNDIILSMFLRKNQETLLSVSNDGHFKVWNIPQRKIDLKLNLSRSPQLLNDPSSEKKELYQLTHFLFTENNYIGGYIDGLIVMWNTNGEIMEFFEGHQKQINGLILLEDNCTFVSGSSDKSIRIWNMKKTIPLKIFRFDEEIKLMDIFENRLFTVGGENFLYIIDLQKELIISRLFLQNLSISAFYRMNTSLLFGSRDGFLYKYEIPELEEGKNAKEIKVFINSGWIYSIKDWQNLILIGSDEKVVKIYNKKSMELVEELYGHEDAISSMEIGNKFLFTGSLDHSIRSWDVSEIENRVRERRLMEREELMSRKIEAVNKVLGKKGKKKGSPDKKAEEKTQKKPEKKSKKEGKEEKKSVKGEKKNVKGEKKSVKGEKTEKKPAKKDAKAKKK